MRVAAVALALLASAPLVHADHYGRQGTSEYACLLVVRDPFGGTSAFDCRGSLMTRDVPPSDHDNGTWRLALAWTPAENGFERLKVTLGGYACGSGPLPVCERTVASTAEGASPLELAIPAVAGLVELEWRVGPPSDLPAGAYVGVHQPMDWRLDHVEP